MARLFGTSVNQQPLDIKKVPSLLLTNFLSNHRLADEPTSVAARHRPRCFHMQTSLLSRQSIVPCFCLFIRLGTIGGFKQSNIIKYRNMHTDYVFFFFLSTLLSCPLHTHPNQVSTLACPTTSPLSFSSSASFSLANPLSISASCCPYLLILYQGSLNNSGRP